MSENLQNEPTGALDRVIGEIRDEPIDTAEADRAAGRVWSNLAGSGAGPRLVEKIRSCEDFQALFEDYRAGRLPEGRRLLVEDHTHECVACRKVLAGRPKVAEFPAPQTARKANYKWAVAAAVVIGVGLGTAGVVYYVNGPAGSRTTVASVNGALYRVSDRASAAVKAGDELPAGAEIRTAKDSGAVVRLRDGSLVEMRERSGFSVSESGTDLTVNLGLGSIIVQAAKRHAGHLYVATRDCKVAVTGTVFSVNSGVKGSRVSVIEGEVHVTKDKDEKVLHPGEQYSSTASLAAVPVQDEIAWSRDFDRHAAALKALVDLQKQLDQIHFPDLRYSSRLFNMAPASTAIYVSIPNLGKTLVEAQQVIQSHVQQNPALEQWWTGLANHGFRPDAVIGRIAHFSEYIGDEIVLAAPMNDGKLGAPVILAELKRPGFREFIQAELDKAGHGGAGIHIIDDAARANGAGPWMLVRPDLLAIAPDGAALRFGDGAFGKTPFGARVAAAYRGGAGILFTADLEKVAKTAGDVAPGVTSIRSLLVEQKESAGRTDMRATVSFAGPRQGIFSWLAPPAPMRALDFISPEAGFVAAFTVKSPAQALDDLQARDGLFSQELIDSLAKSGFDLKADLAAPLGGEFALALDGPVLPPAWKLVVEVYDAGRLENTIERLVELHNRECAGKVECAVALTHETANGRTVHTLKIPKVPFGDAQYTFLDGYMLAAPNRQLLDRAIQYRASGYTLTRAPAFVAMVPRDHYSNFSAMVYQNAGPQLAPLAGLLGGMNVLSPEQKKAVGDVAGQLKPMMLTAYGEEDRITVAANTNLLGLTMNNLIQGNLLGMTRGMGLPGMFSSGGTPRRRPAYSH
jgi:hypothetical protein